MLPLRRHMLRRVGPVNILIRIRRPFRLRVRRLPAPPRAATRAEGPEQATSRRTRHGQPHVSEHRASQREGNAVAVLQRGVESGAEARIGYGGEEDEGAEEGGADQGGDGGEDAAEAGEEAADADEDFHGGGDDGEDEERGEPLRGVGLVPRQGVVELLPEELGRERVVEPPDRTGIEPELQLARGAVVDRQRGGLPDGEDGGRGVGGAAAAVAPEADGVEVVEVEFGMRGEEGGVVGGGGGVGLEEVDVGEVGVLDVCAAEADHDEEDEGGDGEEHGDGDADEAAGFAHFGGCLGVCGRRAGSGVWLQFGVCTGMSIYLPVVE